MEVKDFCNHAKQLAAQIKLKTPAYASEKNAALCLITTNTQEIISGVSSVGINNGEVVSFSAEYNAIVSMLAANHKAAKRIIIISLADNSIVMPEQTCLDILLKLNPENTNCEIVVSENRTVLLKNMTYEAELQPDEAEMKPTETGLQPDEVEIQPVDAEPQPTVAEPQPVEATPQPTDTEPQPVETTPQPEAASAPAVADFFSGFDDAAPESANAFADFDSGFDASYSAPQHTPVKKTASAAENEASLGAPADFAAGFSVDESNPFYEPSGTDTEPAPVCMDTPTAAASAEDAQSPASVPTAAADVPAAAQNSDEMLSKEDLLKKAKKRKKIAKSNFHFFNK